MVEWAATVLSGGYNQRLKIKKEDKNLRNGMVRELSTKIK